MRDLPYTKSPTLQRLIRIRYAEGPTLDLPWSRKTHLPWTYPGPTLDLDLPCSHAAAHDWT
jgi:hypothetical protein